MDPHISPWGRYCAGFESIWASLLGEFKGQPGARASVQAGHQGPRGVAAELPRVSSNNPRQPLGEAIRKHVVQVAENSVEDVSVLHGVA